MDDLVHNCPLDLRTIVAGCGFPEMRPLQAVAWRRVKESGPVIPGDHKSHVEVVLLGEDRGRFILIRATEGWQVWRIKVPMFESEKEENHAAAVMGGLKEDDYWDDVEGMRELDHYPSQQEVQQFKEFVGWNQLPEGWLVVWEGECPLKGFDHG